MVSELFERSSCVFYGSKSVANPTSLRYFSIPEYLKKEITGATRLAKKLADASVSESLMREFKFTSNQLGRTIRI